METIYAKLAQPSQPDPAVLEQAAAFLKKGEVVAFPTETVYGLGGNALDETAVAKIFAAKGRPNDNPLIVHVSSPREVEAIAQINPLAQKLMAAFWPGPLTLVLPKKPCVPNAVTAGGSTVAVRLPAHPAARALIAAAGLPIAAPSANLSGKPSPTTGRHVWQDLQGLIAMVIDGGAAAVGVESTVLDVTTTPPVILRPGGITKEMLLPLCGQVAEAGHTTPVGIAPKAPGMKYPHYAPQGKVFLATSDSLNQVYHELTLKYHKVGVLLCQESQRPVGLPAESCRVLGSREDLAEVAHALFDALRWCDMMSLDAVLVETVPETGIGAAIMNRLRKAACAHE